MSIRCSITEIIQFCNRYSTQWQTLGEAKYRWLDRNRLEIVDGDETTFTILAYFETLAVAVETARRLNTSEQVLCGSSNGKWERDILNLSNESYVNDTETTKAFGNLTQSLHDEYVNNMTRKMKTRMITEYAASYRTGGGYMLGFGNSYLSLIVNFSYPILSQVSIEIWVKLSVSGSNANLTAEGILEGKRVLYSIVQQDGNLTLLYDKEVVLQWGKRVINTGLTVKNLEWVHLSLTWRNSDGRVVIMLAYVEGYQRTYIHYGFYINAAFYIDKGMYIGNDGTTVLLGTELILEVDELLIWQYARESVDLIKTMTLKREGYIEGLIVFCGFDEGYGMTTNGTLFALRDNATISGYYYRQHSTADQIIVYEMKPINGNPLWKPSGAPYPNVGNYEINFETSELERNAKNECYKLFYTGNLYKYCGKYLVSQTLFYYRACLMDVTNSGSILHSKISVSTFAFYCQKVLLVSRCQLHGFYDGFPACEESDDFDLHLIFICVGVAIIILVLICVIIICVCRRRKKKDEQDSGRGCSIEHGSPAIGMYSSYGKTNGGSYDAASYETPPPYNYNAPEFDDHPNSNRNTAESYF